VRLLRRKKIPATRTGAGSSRMLRQFGTDARSKGSSREEAQTKSPGCQTDLKARFLGGLAAAIVLETLRRR
jgi:hypothetical protein